MSYCDNGVILEKKLVEAVEYNHNENLKWANGTLKLSDKENESSQCVGRNQKRENECLII
jgi:hypothetical protein